MRRIIRSNCRKISGDDKERGVKTDGPADRHLWENAIKYYVWNEPDVYEA